MDWRVPCKYHEIGCQASLSLYEKAQHEDVCEYGPCACPFPGAACPWQGQREDIYEHLTQDHGNITNLNGTDTVFQCTNIFYPGSVDWIMLQTCFKKVFILFLAKEQRCNNHIHYYSIVELIGSQMQAESFTYELELTNGRRRLAWKATPRTCHEGVATAILNYDCLVFDTNTARLFADQRESLSINVTISSIN